MVDPNVGEVSRLVEFNQVLEGEFFTLAFGLRLEVSLNVEGHRLRGGSLGENAAAGHHFDGLAELHQVHPNDLLQEELLLLGRASLYILVFRRFKRVLFLDLLLAPEILLNGRGFLPSNLELEFVGVVIVGLLQPCELL